MLVLPKGVRHIPGHLDRAAQEALLEAVRAVVQAAPLFVPAMPRTGKEMSVRMTNCGQLGWVTDRERGYRYQATHPVTGEPWPPIPEALLRIWETVSGYPHQPQACLVNFYAETAKMGLHQDRDEAESRARSLSEKVRELEARAEMAESNLRTVLATVRSKNAEDPARDARVSDSEMEAILGVLKGDDTVETPAVATPDPETA